MSPVGGPLCTPLGVTLYSFVGKLFSLMEESSMMPCNHTGSDEVEILLGSSVNTSSSL